MPSSAAAFRNEQTGGGKPVFPTAGFSWILPPGEFVKENEAFCLT